MPTSIARFFLPLLLVTLLGARAEANINVFPKSMFINMPNTSTAITVINTGGTREEIWIDFRYGYPTSNDSGTFYMIYGDSTTTSGTNAVPWLTAYPQRFTLKSGESQIVRVIIKPPIGLASAEYWARVVIASKPSTATTPRVPGQTVAPTFQNLTRVDIPMHVRMGAVGSGLKIQGVTSVVDTGWLKLGIDLSRLGNASFWGTMRFTIRDGDGRVALTYNQSVAIYNDLVYPVAMNVSKLSPGQYLLEINVDNKRSDVPIRYRVKAEEVRFTYQFSIP